MFKDLTSNTIPASRNVCCDMTINFALTVNGEKSPYPTVLIVVKEKKYGSISVLKPKSSRSIIL